MYDVNLSTFLETPTEKEDFIKALKLFYDQTLYEEKIYKVFIEEINKFSTLEAKKQEKRLIELFCKIIKNKPERKNISNKIIEFTSVAIATTYKYNNQLFEMAKEGGSKNFIYYILLVLSLKDANRTTKLLILAEMEQVRSSMLQMRYYRHNPPDLIIQ